MNKNNYKHSRPLNVHGWQIIKVKVGTKWTTICSAIQAHITKYAYTSIGYDPLFTWNGALWESYIPILCTIGDYILATP